MAMIIPVDDIIRDYSLDGATVIKVRDDSDTGIPDVLTIISDVIEFNDDPEYPLTDLIEEIADVFMEKVHDDLVKDESLQNLHRSDITAVFQDITSEVDYIVSHMSQLISDRFQSITGRSLNEMKPCMTKWLKDNSLMIVGI